MEAPENTNNAANYEEIEGHVKVLSAKLSQMTSSNTGVQAALEDLEDYYERAIQLRMYRVQTLEESLKEKTAEYAEREKMHKLMLYFLVCIFVVNSMLKHPEATFNFIYHTWSYIVVALVAGVLSSWRA
jgi:cation transport ATPase